MSRRFGGIHFERGDLMGRVVGRQIGALVWERAQQYISGLGQRRRTRPRRGSQPDEPTVWHGIHEPQRARSANERTIHVAKFRRRLPYDSLRWFASSRSL
jgi:hypothetical protein